MRVFYGIKTPGGAGAQGISVIDLDRMTKRPVHHVVRHSPDGFQWGYGGSGPSDAALSIMSEVFEGQPHKVEKWYQDFKRDFLVGAGDVLLISDWEIVSWVRGKEINPNDLS